MVPYCNKAPLYWGPSFENGLRSAVEIGPTRQLRIQVTKLGKIFGEFWRNLKIDLSWAVPRGILVLIFLSATRAHTFVSQLQDVTHGNWIGKVFKWKNISLKWPTAVQKKPFKYRSRFFKRKFGAVCREFVVSYWITQISPTLPISFVCSNSSLQIKTNYVLGLSCSLKENESWHIGSKSGLHWGEGRKRLWSSTLRIWKHQQTTFC